MDDSFGAIFVIGIVGTLFFLGLLIWLIIRATNKSSQEKIKKTAISTFDMPDLDSLTDSSDFDTIATEQNDTQISSSEAILEMTSESTQPQVEKSDLTVTDKKEDVQNSLLSVRLNTGHVTKGEPLMTILRDSRDQHLIVQVNDMAYRTLVDSPQIKKEFLKVMKELSVIVTKPDENPPVESGKETNIPQKGKTKLLPTTDDGKMPGDLPSYALDDNVVPTGGGRYKVESIPEFNLAKAIEEYLQHKLKYTSEYVNHVLHIHPAAGGGVRIQVDDKYYDAVGDIEDDHIRSFFIATIQEWHDRQ